MNKTLLHALSILELYIDCVHVCKTIKLFKTTLDEKLNTLNGICKIGVDQLCSLSKLTHKSLFDQQITSYSGNLFLQTLFLTQSSK